MAAAETQEALALEVLAEQAKLGLRNILIVGKVIDKKLSKSERTGETSVKLTVVYSEGLSMTVKADQTASVPGVGHEGAFLVGKPGEYMNMLSAPLIAWK